MSELRTVGWLSRVEGVSLLVLLLVAMPLKYLFAEPLAVRVVGTFHGVFFLALCSASIAAALEATLSAKQALRVLLWSVVPFGFLFTERTLRARCIVPR